MYIYLSNEEEANAYEVYFDDFKVEHIKSPVIQTEDYYPFGLTFNERTRENTLGNLVNYNSKEKQDALDLGWLDYGARMYMSELGRWGAVDRMAEKYFQLSPYTFVLNNPLILVDPNGMEVIPINGGYKYTGADVAGVYRFLTNRNKNVYMALIESKRLRRSTNNKDDYKGWSVFGVTTAAEASTLMAVKYAGSKGKLDNFIYEAHGGVVKNHNKNFFKTKIKEEGSTDWKEVITSDRICNYNNQMEKSDAQISAIVDLMDYVKTNGNFVFNTCNTMIGVNGDEMLRSLAELSGNRINITGAESFVTHSSSIKDRDGYVGEDYGLDIGGTLNATDYNKEVNVKASWKSIRTSNGQIKHYSGVTITSDDVNAVKFIP